MGTDFTAVPFRWDKAHDNTAGIRMMNFICKNS